MKGGERERRLAEAVKCSSLAIWRAAALTDRQCKLYFMDLPANGETSALLAVLGGRWRLTTHFRSLCGRGGRASCSSSYRQFIWSGGKLRPPSEECDLNHGVCNAKGDCAHMLLRCGAASAPAGFIEARRKWGAEA